MVVDQNAQSYLAEIHKHLGGDKEHMDSGQLWSHNGCFLCAQAWSDYLWFIACDRRAGSRRGVHLVGTAVYAAPARTLLRHSTRDNRLVDVRTVSKEWFPGPPFPFNFCVFLCVVTH